jgi:hypothetical protein
LFVESCVTWHLLSENSRMNLAEREGFDYRHF